MNLYQQLKWLTSRPPRSQIKYIVSTYINGKLSKKFYGKSLLGNFLHRLYVSLAAGVTVNFPVGSAPFDVLSALDDITGASRSIYNQYYWDISANTADASHGLVFGRGDTAVSAVDISLETICAEGTGANQLNYQTQTANQGCEVSSLTTSFILQRIAVNNSGAQINIWEIGLYFYAVAWSFILYRDVLSSADAVGDGDSYRVTLEISVTS